MKKEKTVRIELPVALLSELKEITDRTTYKAAVEFVIRKTISANAAREIQRQAVTGAVDETFGTLKQTLFDTQKT